MPIFCREFLTNLIMCIYYILFFRHASHNTKKNTKLIKTAMTHKTINNNKFIKQTCSLKQDRNLFYCLQYTPLYKLCICIIIFILVLCKIYYNR